MRLTVTVAAVTIKAIAEPAALTLANTVRAGPSGPVDLLARAPAADVALRDAIRALLLAAADGTAPPRAALAHVNAVLAAAPPPRLRRRGGAFVTEAAPRPVELARSCLAVLTGEGAPPVRRCAATGCVLLFVAGHPTRRTCSTACATRERVARHRARRHAGGGGSDPSFSK